MKRVLLLMSVFVIAVIAALNLQLVENELGDLRLQNIEILSYGETSTSLCVGSGSIDCPRYGTKARFIW